MTRPNACLRAVRVDRLRTTFEGLLRSCAPPNEGRRLLASLERCGRRGIRFSESVGFLLTLLRRVLLLLSFFGFPRLVAHGAPPVVRVSNERIGCVQQYHLRHASGQRGTFSRSEPSRSRAVSVRSRSRLASHIAGRSPRTHDKRKCGQTRPTPSWSRGYLAAQWLAAKLRPRIEVSKRPMSMVVSFNPSVAGNRRLPWLALIPVANTPSSPASSDLFPRTLGEPAFLLRAPAHR